MEEQELNLTFEEAMDKLEQIVSEMERGGIPLEQMMSKFEEGAKLAKYCQEKLAGLICPEKSSDSIENPLQIPDHVILRSGCAESGI